MLIEYFYFAYECLRLVWLPRLFWLFSLCCGNCDLVFLFASLLMIAWVLGCFELFTSACFFVAYLRCLHDFGVVILWLTCVYCLFEICFLGCCYNSLCLIILIVVLMVGYFVLVIDYVLLVVVSVALFIYFDLEVAICFCCLLLIVFCLFYLRYVVCIFLFWFICWCFVFVVLLFNCCLWLLTLHLFWFDFWLDCACLDLVFIAMQLLVCGVCFCVCCLICDFDFVVDYVVC